MKLSLQAFWVALRKESVDRNLLFLFFLLFFGIVALRKESVDRNINSVAEGAVPMSRTPQGERG